MRRTQRAAEGDRAADVERVETGAALAAGDADFQRAGAAEYQIAGHGQQTVRTQHAVVRQRVRTEAQAAEAADDA